MSISSTSSTSSAQSTANAAASASSSTSSATATQTNFLTLLVAQLNSQDPMNPMDNAQMTTQMAQLNMVSGIDKLNTTVQSMATQFSAMQTMQGASLVGKNVVANGANLPLNAGVGNGAINLGGNADAVSVNILAPSGQVLDTINLGPQSAGQVPFSWNTSTYANSTGLTFSITATSGGQAVTATPLELGTVVAANPSATGLTLTLQGQATPVAYSDIVSIL